uniref:(northern house mosquito) hypothetical protein n=1 Tax=Culex pipiens TaxID=7175 RepID=A0A8D8CF93_CULPI
MLRHLQHQFQPGRIRRQKGRTASNLHSSQISSDLLQSSYHMKQAAGSNLSNISRTQNILFGNSTFAEPSIGKLSNQLGNMSRNDRKVPEPFTKRMEPWNAKLPGK